MEFLDLSGNNISLLPQDVFHGLTLLRTLSLRDNKMETLNPTELFNGFQFNLYDLDLSGMENIPITIQDLRRWVHLKHGLIFDFYFKIILRPAVIGNNVEKLHSFGLTLKHFIPLLFTFSYIFF